MHAHTHTHKLLHLSTGFLILINPFLIPLEQAHLLSFACSCVLLNLCLNQQHHKRQKHNLGLSQNLRFFYCYYYFVSSLLLCYFKRPGGNPWPEKAQLLCRQPLDKARTKHGPNSRKLRKSCWLDDTIHSFCKAEFEVCWLPRETLPQIGLFPDRQFLPTCKRLVEVEDTNKWLVTCQPRKLTS